MSHTFSLMPQSYLVHQRIQATHWKYGCVSCGVWAKDPAGSGCIHSDCAAFNKSHGGHNPFGPGGKDYPFSFQWICAPVPPSSNQQQQASQTIISTGSIPAPPMTASGLPIRAPDAPVWGGKVEAPAKVATPADEEKRPGLVAEEIDWQAHKDFMRGM